MYKEGFVDSIISLISEKTLPKFKKINFTPNGITTLSLIFGLLSVFLFYKKHYYSAALSYFISYIFDCTDGMYARKYNMVTKFGDYYDHIKDVIVYILLIVVFIIDKSISIKYKII